MHKIVLRTIIIVGTIMTHKGRAAWAASGRGQFRYLSGKADFVG
ncbi:MAG: hypothetical protein ABSD41_11405 [Candidatus Bathyarchaeia archaeon]